MATVRNPHFADPVATFAAARAAAFDSWLQEPAQAAQPRITFDAIRAAFPALADPLTGSPPLTDGTIAAALAVLGYVVDVEP